jgi:hypothetical protein
LITSVCNFAFNLPCLIALVILYIRVALLCNEGIISFVISCIGGSIATGGSCCIIGSFVATLEYFPRLAFVILPVFVV